MFVFVFVCCRTSPLSLVCQKNMLRPARCASLCRRARPCSRGSTTPRSGRWTLTLVSAGRTPSWDGPPRKFFLPTCVPSGIPRSQGSVCLSVFASVFLWKPPERTPASDDKLEPSSETGLVCGNGLGANNMH